LLSPGNSDQIVDSSGGGVTVNFAWQDPEGNPASSFHLQVARSAIFASDSIMVDRGDLQTHDFRLAGLTPGTYYWRLKATGRSGQATNWNDQWKFSVVRGGGGAAIDAVDWRVEPIGGNVYLINGRTQPGMSVRSQKSIGLRRTGRSIPASDHNDVDRNGRRDQRRTRLAQRLCNFP
jgi:hypothetical protein